MGPRKICYLTPQYFDDQSYVGGGERYPQNLARGVADRSGGRFEVEILSFGPRPARSTLVPGVTLRILKAAYPPRDPLDVLSWELPEAFADAALVHIHQAYTRCSEMGLLAAKQQRKPVCVTDHGGFSSPLGQQLGILDLADRIVCQSRFAASLIQTKASISVIRGGVDGEHFTPPDVRPKRDRILFVGRLLPHKGIDRLITALPPDLPLTVCGRPYHDDYFGLLKRLAAGKKVEFLLDTDDATIRELYRRAWANVLPSVHHDCYGNTHLAPELMGFTLLEAMACGTPAICSRVAGMPEFIDEGKTGFVFDTLEELTDRLRYLAGHPEVADAMGRQARRSVETEFDLRVAGARLGALYDLLMSRACEVAA